MAIFPTLPERLFQPCIPTRAANVPDGPDEMKHDGYRLIVRREGERLRLFTRRHLDVHSWLLSVVLTEKPQI